MASYFCARQRPHDPGSHFFKNANQKNFKTMRPKTATPKKYAYHVSHSYTTDTGKKISFMTQLYRVGIYAVIYVDNSLHDQLNLTPQDIVKFERNLEKEKSKGKIENLEYGREITVSDVSGLWEEVTPAQESTTTPTTTATPKPRNRKSKKIDDARK